MEYIDSLGPIVWTTARHRTGPPCEKTDVIAKGRQCKYVQWQVSGHLQSVLLLLLVCLICIFVRVRL